MRQPLDVSDVTKDSCVLEPAFEDGRGDRVDLTKDLRCVTVTLESHLETADAGEESGD